MIWTLTARRLEPGAYAEFRSAWDPQRAGDAHALRGWTQIYHARDLDDPDVVISLGLFDGSPEELWTAQQRLGRRSQVERVEQHIADVLLDGSYEVVEELRPGNERAS